MFELTTKTLTYIGILQILVEWESTQDVQFCELSVARVNQDLSSSLASTSKRKKKPEPEPEYKETFLNKRSVIHFTTESRLVQFKSVEDSLGEVRE